MCILEISGPQFAFRIGALNFWRRPLPSMLPVLEHAVGTPRADAMEADDGGARPGGWPGARTLEAAEALVMLSES